MRLLQPQEKRPSNPPYVSLVYVHEGLAQHGIVLPLQSLPKRRTVLHLARRHCQRGTGSWGFERPSAVLSSFSPFIIGQGNRRRRGRRPLWWLSTQLGEKKSVEPQNEAQQSGKLWTLLSHTIVSITPRLSRETGTCARKWMSDRINIANTCK